MKKGIILSFLLSILCANPLSAQMMPDSTVHITAYWEVGDTADYIVSQKKYKIDENEGETLTASTDRAIHIEVVEATDTTYTLAITDEDAFSFGLGVNLPEEDRAALPPLTYRVITDEFGTLLRLENGAEVYEQGLQILPVLTEAVYKGLGERAKALYASKEDFLEDLTRNLKNPEYLNSFLIKDINDLLFFHGAALDTTKQYSLETLYSIPTIGETVKMKGACWVDTEWTDEYSAVLRREFEGSDAALDALRNYLYRLQVDEEDALNYEEFCKEFDKEVTNGKFSFRLEDYFVEEVHLDSGWPIKVIYDFYIVAKVSDDVNGTHQSREISLIFDEEEEGSGEE